MRPVPQQSGESVSLDCAGKEETWWQDFLSTLEATTYPRHATLASEIDRLLGEQGVDAKDCKRILQERGIKKLRGKRGLDNTYFYTYSFPDNDGNKSAVSYVKVK